MCLCVCVLGEFLCVCVCGLYLLCVLAFNVRAFAAPEGQVHGSAASPKKTKSSLNCQLCGVSICIYNCIYIYCMYICMKHLAFGDWN